MGREIGTQAVEEYTFWPVPYATLKDGGFSREQSPGTESLWPEDETLVDRG